MNGATEFRRLATQGRKRKSRAPPVPKPPKDTNTINTDIAAWLSEHPDDPAAPLLRKAKDEIVRLTRDHLQAAQDAVGSGDARDTLYQSGTFWVNMTNTNGK